MKSLITFCSPQGSKWLQVEIVDGFYLEGDYYRGVLKPKNRNKSEGNPKTALNCSRKPETVKICDFAPGLHK